MGAPIVDIQGSVSPAGVTRPKHKRTFTGFGAGDIKSVEGEHIFNYLYLPFSSFVLFLISVFYVLCIKKKEEKKTSLC